MGCSPNPHPGSCTGMGVTILQPFISRICLVAIPTGRSSRDPYYVPAAVTPQVLHCKPALYTVNLP